MFAHVVCKSVSPLRLCPRAHLTVARASSPSERSEQQPESSPVEDVKPTDPTINAVTGNPQTGKLIDVYFEVGAFLVVVAVAFLSLWNVQDVLTQTSQADSIREPANKAEWARMDSKEVSFQSILLRMEKMRDAGVVFPVPPRPG
jgi:hypothetical protein